MSESDSNYLIRSWLDQIVGSAGKWKKKSGLVTYTMAISNA